MVRKALRVQQCQIRLMATDAIQLHSRVRRRSLARIAMEVVIRRLNPVRQRRIPRLAQVTAALVKVGCAVQASRTNQDSSQATAMVRHAIRHLSPVYQRRAPQLAQVKGAAVMDKALTVLCVVPTSPATPAFSLVVMAPAVKEHLLTAPCAVPTSPTTLVIHQVAAFTRAPARVATATARSSKARSGV